MEEEPLNMGARLDIQPITIKSGEKMNEKQCTTHFRNTAYSYTHVIS